MLKEIYGYWLYKGIVYIIGGREFGIDYEDYMRERPYFRLRKDRYRAHCYEDPRHLTKKA